MSTQRPPAPPTPFVSRPRAMEPSSMAPDTPTGIAGANGGRSSLAGPAEADQSPEGRRERHRRETFERLVRAARQIMFSRGFNDITVQDITEAADVGKGTFFNYFRSKEHIVTRVQEYNRRGLVVALDRVRRGEQTPLEALTDILTWILCPSGGDWLTYQSNTMRALALHPEVREYFSPELRSNQELYAQIMAVGQQQGRIRTDIPAEDLATITQTFTSGMTVLYWIHGVVPTPALVADELGKLFTLLSPAAAELQAEPETNAATPERGARAKRPVRRARAARAKKPAKLAATSGKKTTGQARASASRPAGRAGGHAAQRSGRKAHGGRNGSKRG